VLCFHLLLTLASSDFTSSQLRSEGNKLVKIVTKSETRDAMICNSD
jgi:hypothetical protein